MAGSAEFTIKDVPGLTREVREEVIAAFDALSNWRDEVDTANERCLKKVLDQTAKVAKALGWNDQTIRATREYLETVAKMQSEAIDQLTETWKRQLTSSTQPMAIPRGFSGLIPGLEAPAVTGGMAPFAPFTPWAFWMQAAEAWQRTWMQEVDSRRDRRSH